MSAAVEAPFVDAAKAALSTWTPFAAHGRVRSVVGLLVEVEGLGASIGAFCEIEAAEVGAKGLPAEVVGFRDVVTLVMPLGPLRGLRGGARVRSWRGRKPLRCRRSRAPSPWPGP